MTFNVECGALAAGRSVWGVGAAAPSRPRVMVLNQGPGRSTSDAWEPVRPPAAPGAGAQASADIRASAAFLCGVFIFVRRSVIFL